ncbi:sulfatase [Flammeovirga sp. EKP202]|uniref:sulfatase family protein n=1 Tax=Flammeovirga sp. EKP202 TaxID=2770592 RepID=UPI00165EFE8E|nr:sulfatase-like hydrolase/transferase [Flammeovirga sp. EKP202]MBD0401740.1 sulfatase-like hydrolase/transferase [Flammeovirga sp. EKP202]
MKKYQLIIFMILGTLLLTSARFTNGKEKKPNVIIIYTDQQRYNTIQALGNQFIKTPNLNKLMQDGIAFKNSFVTAPVCTSSRSSLHSGMYVSSHKTYSNHHGGGRPQTNLPLELKKNGYQTAVIGKNHSFLNKQDIDVFIHTPRFKSKPEDKRSAIKAMPWEVEEDPMFKLTDSAINLLKENDDPQFIWLSYLYPHSPFMLPEPYFSMYDTIDIPKPVVEANGLKEANKPFRQQIHQKNNDLLLPYDLKTTMRMKRNYYGMISMIDAEIGRLISFLKKENLYDNTIIIFTSDHGDYMGDHGLYTKSPAMYDCLVRVPLIITYPQKVGGNIISSELISNIDLMPTILDFVDIDIPSQVEGISFVDYLTDGSEKHLRKNVIAEYGLPGNSIHSFEELEAQVPSFPERPFQFSKGVPWEANPVALAGRFRMLRTENWKLVYDNDKNSELYDLENDPNELHNLYFDESYSRIKNRLIKALKKEMKKYNLDQSDALPISTENIERYNEYISKDLNVMKMY